jgi:hypothetical protein
MVADTTVSPSSCKHPVVEHRRKYGEFCLLCFSRNDDLARARGCYKSIPRACPRTRPNQSDLGSRDVKSSPCTVHLLLVGDFLFVT